MYLSIYDRTNLFKTYTLYIQLQCTSHVLQGIAKLLWSQGHLQLDNTPFAIVETRRLDCQFGQRYYKEKAQKSTRLKLQGSRKLGCHAHIQVKKCIVYPEYKVTEEELKQLSLRTLKEKKMSALKLELAKNPTAVTTKLMSYVSLPTEEAHTSHPTGGGVAGFSQRVNSQVAAQIGEIVADGITDKSQVRTLLHRYVMHELCSKAPPDPNDRAYFPTDNDLKNHIYMAKRALQLSCLDQENVHLKIEQWKKTHPECTHLFRSYIQKGDIEESLVCSTTANTVRSKSSYVGNDAVDDTTVITDKCSYTQTLLWVHQTEWQKELLKRYGNTISLIDATYKTTRYDLALFFICVRTNVGYSVVAEFVVQSENKDNIEEALKVLKKWNTDWNPQYFMSDYSEAELSAVEAVFPSTKVYLCDFHREQAWVRWTRDHKHGLSPVEAENLLDSLRVCAWAPPVDGNEPEFRYHAAVDSLKKSSAWKNHLAVREWLANKWLSIPEVKCSTHLNGLCIKIY